MPCYGMFWVEQCFLCKIQGRSRRKIEVLQLNFKTLSKSIIACPVDYLASVGIFIAAENF